MHPADLRYQMKNRVLRFDEFVDLATACVGDDECRKYQMQKYKRKGLPIEGLHSKTNPHWRHQVALRNTCLYSHPRTHSNRAPPTRYWCQDLSISCPCTTLLVISVILANTPMSYSKAQEAGGMNLRERDGEAAVSMETFILPRHLVRIIARSTRILCVYYVVKARKPCSTPIALHTAQPRATPKRQMRMTHWSSIKFDLKLTKTYKSFMMKL